MNVGHGVENVLIYERRWINFNSGILEFNNILVDFVVVVVVIFSVCKQLHSTVVMGNLLYSCGAVTYIKANRAIPRCSIVGQVLQVCKWSSFFLFTGRYRAAIGWRCLQNAKFEVSGTRRRMDLMRSNWFRGSMRRWVVVDDEGWDVGARAWWCK